MSTSAINAISATTLEQALAAIESAAATRSSTATTSTAASSSVQSDSSQISPLGQLISTLHQLQTTDPAKYAQVTQQIATSLQSAAQTAQTQGNSSEAKQLTALAADFSGASKSGQVSTLVQDLTRAAGGGHHRHGGSGGASTADSTTGSTSTAYSASNNQLLSLFPTNESQSTQSTNLTAAAIILNTLNSSGITSA